MSLLVLVILIVLPAVGALSTRIAALGSWQTFRGEEPQGADLREARGRMVALVFLPITLFVLGLVVTLLVLGEKIPDTLALPAALAYGVPGLLSGLGTAIVYRRGFVAGVISKQGFTRVVSLAVMPFTAAVFGLVTSLLLLGTSSGLSPSLPPSAETMWLVTLLSMAGGVGAVLGAWLAVRTWDFETMSAWSRTLSRATWGDHVTALCFVLAMAFLRAWYIVLAVAVYFGAGIALGAVLFIRARRNRLQRARE